MKKLLASVGVMGLLLAPLSNMNNAHAYSSCHAPVIMWATGYSIYGYTASGAYVHPGTIAVDPTVIPLGSTVWVSGIRYITGKKKYLAEDTGSDIQGYRVDVWVPYTYLAYKITGWRSIRWCTY